MKKVLLFLGIFVILIIVGVLVYQNLIKKGEEISPELKISMPKKTLEGKKIAMIIAFRDFRDEEYFIPKNTLKAAGAEIVTVSDAPGIAVGAEGGEAGVNLVLENLEVENYDAIVFIGGPGAISHLDNENSYQIAKETIEKDKVLGAICISPIILAKAGVLKGKKATVWSSVMDKSAVKILKENGAIYQDEQVVLDGKIVTANGPAAAKKFGEKVVEALTKE